MSQIMIKYFCCFLNSEVCHKYHMVRPPIPKFMHVLFVVSFLCSRRDKGEITR